MEGVRKDYVHFSIFSWGHGGRAYRASHRPPVCREGKPASSLLGNRFSSASSVRCRHTHTHTHTRALPFPGFFTARNRVRNTTTTKKVHFSRFIILLSTTFCKPQRAHTHTGHGHDDSSESEKLHLQHQARSSLRGVGPVGARRRKSWHRRARRGRHGILFVFPKPCLTFCGKCQNPRTVRLVRIKGGRDARTSLSEMD